MMLVLASGSVLAMQSAGTVPQVMPSDFALLEDVRRERTEEASPLVPERPRNLDVRQSQVDAPEAEWRVAVDGPVLAVGAMGGRRSGRPKLAHVSLDWSF